jgi:hypothetical protein
VELNAGRGLAGDLMGVEEGLGWHSQNAIMPDPTEPAITHTHTHTHKTAVTHSQTIHTEVKAESHASVTRHRDTGSYS